MQRQQRCTVHREAFKKALQWRSIIIRHLITTLELRLSKYYYLDPISCKLLCGVI